jgi:hypothetical protein
MFDRKSVQTVFLALMLAGFYIGWMYDFVPDDAYYYIEPAWNHAVGHGLTFDGHHRTNGFHPLWMVTLIGFANLVPSKPILYAAVGVVTVILACSVPWLFQRGFGRDQRLHGWEWVAALPVLVFGAAAPVVGTEAMLNAALLVALFAIMASPVDLSRQEAFGDFLLAGVVLGFAMLARLDNVFLGAAICSWLLYRRGLRDALATGVAATVVVAPYLVWNRILHHDLVPISGQIKSTAPIPQWQWDLMPVQGGMIVFSICVAIVLQFRRPAGKYTGLYTVFVVGAALQTTYHWAFSTYTTRYWYAILATVTAGLACALLGSMVIEKLREYLAVNQSTLMSAIDVVVLMALLVVLGLKVSGAQHDRLAAIEVLNQQVEPDERMVAADGGGRLGYFGNFWVLPLDGLILNKSYQDQLIENGARVTFEAAGVDYVLYKDEAGLMEMTCEQPTAGSGEECRRWKLSFRSSLHQQPAGAFTVDSSQVVWERHVKAEGRTWKLVSLRR